MVRILIVDFHEDHLGGLKAYLNAMLQDIPVVIKTCGNPRKALEMQIGLYDVIMIAYNLHEPGLTGPILTGEIREQYGNSPYIIGMSAFSSREIKEKFRKKGANWFYYRTVESEREKLLEKIRSRSRK